MISQISSKQNKESKYARHRRKAKEAEREQSIPIKRKVRPLNAKLQVTKETDECELPQRVIKRTTKTKEQLIESILKNPKAIIRDSLDDSLFYFVQYFWQEVCNDEFIPNWHIHYLCRELEEVAKRVGNNEPKLYDLIINVPPGSTKTLIVSIFFPVWCWTRWFHLRFITAAYSATLSLESAEYSRDLIKSQRFKEIYPELDIKDDKDTKGNFKVVKKKTLSPGRLPQVKNGGNRYSTSVGGTLTGFHAHILIVDDPSNPRKSESDKERLATNRWCDQTLSTRKTNKLVSVTIIVQQRLHQDDTTGHILAKKKANVRHICLPGQIRDYEEQLSPKALKKFYTPDGLFDPRRLPWTVLKELEADLGQYGFAGQVGQRPTPPGGGMFKVDNFQIIDRMPSEDLFVPGIPIVRYWDKAGTQGAGCYTAGVKIAALKDGKFLIMDCKRGQWGTAVRELMIKRTAQADGVQVHQWIEQEGGSGGKESAEATKARLAGYVCYAEIPRGNKVFRADPYSVQVNEGNVLLLRGEWNKEFIDEHRFFPFSTYKDQVDAAGAGFAKVTRSKMAKFR